MIQSTPEDQIIDVGIKLHMRLWTPSISSENWKQPFLLLHGLSSNARTWDQVAARLSMAGHPAAALDQRGHGLSEKPDSSYGFDVFIQDLKAVIDELGWYQPILAGQSWGGNVLLAFAARYPGIASGYVFVDGGFLNLAERGPWEQSKIELRPPDLTGIPRTKIIDRIRQLHPTWGDDGIDATLGNFEILPDQTLRPWLTLERHMLILRSIYEQDPLPLFSQVEEPVLICAAEDGGLKMDAKRQQVSAAAASLAQAEVIWFPNTAHDIHLDQPIKLADSMLSFQKKLTLFP